MSELVKLERFRIDPKVFSRLCGYDSTHWVVHHNMQYVMFEEKASCIESLDVNDLSFNSRLWRIAGFCLAAMQKRWEMLRMTGCDTDSEYSTLNYLWGIPIYELTAMLVIECYAAWCMRRAPDWNVVPEPPAVPTVDLTKIQVSETIMTYDCDIKFLISQRTATERFIMWTTEDGGVVSTAWHQVPMRSSLMRVMRDDPSGPVAQDFLTCVQQLRNREPR